MKKYSYLLILLPLLSASQVQAGAVEKCVDETGKITYTDKGCKGKETSQNTYLGIGAASHKGTTNLQKTSVVGYKVSEVGVLTEQASEQCAKQAGKYLTDSKPGAKQEAEAEFLTVVERALRGAEVEIVLAGVIHYKNEKAADAASQELKIHCAASRTRETDWVLVFKEPGVAD